MKYDDASWHYGGNFPAGLPDAAGATHIGMFVAWAFQSDLGSEEAQEDSGDLIDQLRARQLTPGDWFIRAFDEKFADVDLSDEGNAFAAAYYTAPEGAVAAYLDDYADIFAEIDDTYRVADSWANYDRLAPILTRRFAEWRARRQ